MDEELDLREALLAEAEQCLDQGDPEGALHSAEEVLALDGSVVEAHHLRALALRELGQAAEALVAASAALALEPTYAEAAYTRADLLLFELGQHREALDVCNAFLREDLEDQLYADFLNLKGNALGELGEFDAALGCFERAGELSPERDDPGSRGWALFELGRMDEAIAALLQASPPGQPANPANHFYLAVAFARNGDERGAARHFRIAARGDADLYHVPQPFSDDVLLEAVETALAGLPSALQRELVGVPRRLLPWPKLGRTRRGEDHQSPLSLVELVGRQSDDDEDGEVSSARSTDEEPRATALCIYGRNAAFTAPDRESLLEELQVALWRELVRFFNLGDDDLEGHGIH